MVEPAKSDLSEHENRLRRLLAIARKVKNLTQRDIAARMGQPRSFIGKIENGTRGVSAVELVAICRAIGTDPRRILTRLLKGWPDASAQVQSPTEPSPQDLA